MMIAELFFIVDLLKKRQLMEPSTPTISPPVIYDPDYDYQLKKPKVVPQITEIKLPVVIPPISPNEARDAYLEAVEGIEITALPFLGKR